LWKLRIMLLLKPVTIETIAMTVATPTTMPRIVSPARSLWARTAISANRMFSPKPRRNREKNWVIGSLVPQRFDRVEARCLRGGIPPEKQTARRRHGPPREAGPEGGPGGRGSEDPLHESRHRHAQAHADGPAQERQRGRLGQELQDDVAPKRAHGLA